MATRFDHTIPLLPGQTYHIFNRGNAQDYIFYQERNYIYFLKKYFQYLNGFVKTFAYCLLRNHFHLLIELRAQDEILQYQFNQKAGSEYEFHKFIKNQKIERDFAFKLHSDHPVDTSSLPPETQYCSKIVSEQFRFFLLSYAKAINIQEKRNGSLFQKGFKRKIVPDLESKKNALGYILLNPVRHHICEHTEDFPWSSYHSLMSGEHSDMAHEEVISWFGDKTGLLSFLKEFKESRDMLNF